jgi:hypothetical protein
MYTRRLYRLCEISNHLKLYKSIFSNLSRVSFVLFIHGLVLSSQVVSSSLIARTFVLSKSKRALNYFLNKARFDLNALIEKRLQIAFDFANKQVIKDEKYFFYLSMILLLQKGNIKKLRVLE